MPEVILYVASSLDGYIARANGDVDWLEQASEESEGPPEDYGYPEFIANVGTVLMGRVTYEQVLSFDVDYPYAGKAGYVFSRTRAGERDENTQFVDGSDLPGLIRELKSGAGGNIWLVGGGQLVREFLILDLIDRIELFIQPIILGQGIPLFPPPTPQLNLVLADSRAYSSGMVRLTYRRASET